MRKFLIMLDGEEIIYDVLEGDFMEVASHYGSASRWREQSRIDSERHFVLGAEVRHAQIYDHVLDLVVATFPSVDDMMVWLQYYRHARVKELFLTDEKWFCRKQPCLSCKIGMIQIADG